MQCSYWPLPVCKDCHGTFFVCVISSMPQGSVFGPVLFIVYVNDICAVVPNAVTVKLFADDAKSYSVSGDTSTPDCLLTCLTAIPTGLTIGN